MVAELHAATVRALLLGNVAEHLRLIGEVDSDGSVDAYGLFYEVVFGCAVRRRFGRRPTHGDIIRFVADVRAYQRPDVADFDILAAERLLRGVLGDEEAFQQLTEADTALMGPLLIALGSELSAEELLIEAKEQTDLLERQLAD